MPLETISFEGVSYPAFQASGHAARFIQPFAKEVCKGRGVDVGCGKIAWCLPGAFPIDKTISSSCNPPISDPNSQFRQPLATDFRHVYDNLDYVFSSHCLEHLPDWVEALHYWHSALKVGGVVFLYLPHYQQRYWRPWHNMKHRHVLTAEVVCDCLTHLGFHKIFTAGPDLNASFVVMAEKKVPNEFV